jgi:hypothetical protein
MAVCIPLYLPEIKSRTFPGVLYILILRLKLSTRIAEKMFYQYNTDIVKFDISNYFRALVIVNQYDILSVPSWWA